MNPILQLISATPSRQSLSPERVFRRSARRKVSCFAAFLCAGVVALLNSATAATVSWNDGSAKWESLNWTGGVGSNPPTSTDAAIIGNGGVVGYDSTTGTRTVLSLQLGSNTAPKGSGTLNMSGGSLTITNNLVISDAGNNAGTLTDLTGGTLTVGGNITNGGNGIATLTLNGGTLDMTNGSIDVDVANFQSGTLSNVTQFSISGVIAALTKTTAGTLTLSGTNTYTGGTNINGGILALGSAAALGTTGTISFGGGTLQYSATNTTDYSSRFSTAASQAYNINTNGQNVTFATALTSSGGTLTKSGNGTLKLMANNTYTGVTSITGGTLEINNTNSTSSGRISGTSSITVNSGGTLLLSGSNLFADRINNSATMTLNGGTFNTGGLSEHGANNNTAGIGALTLQSSSIIDLGNLASIVAFANSSAQTWSGTLSIYDWSGNFAIGGGTDQLYVGTDQTGLTASQLLEINFYSDAGGTFLGHAGILSNGEIVPIPEPGTWVAGGLALGGLICYQRRRFARFFKRAK
jgi:fibronectin-binding autotransporter adhesin